MNDTMTTVQNAALGAGMASGLMNTITENATAISVLCTVGFGAIYVSCAIWNAYSNHKCNHISKDIIIGEIIKRLNEHGEESAADAVRRISK